MKDLVKKIRFILVAIILPVCLASCSNDDEPETDINDYYSTCLSVSGDRINSQEADLLKNAIAQAIEGRWTGITRDQANYLFNKEAEEIAEVLDELYREIPFRGTITTVLELRIVSSGKAVGKKTITTDAYGSKVR